MTAPPTGRLIPPLRPCSRRVRADRAATAGNDRDDAYHIRRDRT